MHPIQITHHLGAQGISSAYRLLTMLAGLLISGLVLPLAAQTVSIASPQNNATVPSPVRVQATVSGVSSLKYTQVYIDGVNKYTVQSPNVDTTVSMSAGSHRIAVQAQDSAGRTYKNVVYVTVSSVASNDTSGLTVFSRIEEQSEWKTCGNCGNTGGSVGATASYNMTRGMSSPSIDGSSTKFWIGGPYPYKNGYWYISQKAPAAPVKYLKYEFDLYIPSGDENKPQAIEFECQQRANGYVYNFAWQAEYSGKSWRIFDYVKKVWQPSGLSFTPFSPGRWHHIIAEYHTEGSNVVHDALTVDGARRAVGIKHPGKYVGGTTRYFTNAFQLDLNKTASPYSVYVDAMRVSYK